MKIIYLKSILIAKEVSNLLHREEGDDVCDLVVSIRTIDNVSILTVQVLDNNGALKYVCPSNSSQYSRRVYNLSRISHLPHLCPFMKVLGDRDVKDGLDLVLSGLSGRSEHGC